MMPMDSRGEILIFDLVGKFAHFRKFYTNSSSLSYHFPPRTAIEGIISAMLGQERDSYYDLFLPTKSKIAVSTRTQTRSIMQTVNYLSVKSLGDLSGRGPRTQVPIEIITSDSIYEDLRYRVYFYHEDVSLTKELEERIKQSTFHYPTSFGLANFLCSVDFVGWGTFQKQLFSPNTKPSWNVVTPIPVSALRHFGILSVKDEDTYSYGFVQDIFPFHFEGNRKLGKNMKLLYHKNFAPIRVTTSEKLRVIEYNEGKSQKTEAIVFLEEWSE
jgi:CRISPR-associated protein Cas5h